eukprot:TRINITY_DN11108_c0_g1_i1.p4 TRINITY_DN11108_c0_g1~~TRINITY_DN11108_c0_g1_i1.p4  ORF type:complete len:136 (+),score=41.03 TRINITY_DN11108_c0_g1_i1:500-907(+)
MAMLGISLRDGGAYTIRPEFATPRLFIEDPVSGENVGGSAWRVVEARSMFCNARHFLLQALSAPPPTVDKKSQQQQQQQQQQLGLGSLLAPLLRVDPKDLERRQRIQQVGEQKGKGLILSDEYTANIQATKFGRF